MEEELRVLWNCSEFHLHSMSSSNAYAQVEKGVRAAFGGSWRWKPASLSLYQVSSGTRHHQSVSVTYAFLFLGFFQKDVSNFIAKNCISCCPTNQTYSLHFDLYLKGTQVNLTCKRHFTFWGATNCNKILLQVSCPSSSHNPHCMPHLYCSDRGNDHGTSGRNEP